ncbi:hypothetical protein [Arthrobacter livingstonensis]|nr:hypothetical protein [Arthrobacter livingstonensis]
MTTQAGWKIHWDKLGLDGAIEARIIAISRGSELLRDLLSPAITTLH